MKSYNRKLLLLNEDVPISTSISPISQIKPQNASSPSNSITPSSSSKTFTIPSQLQLQFHPIFSSNIAYTFLLLFSTIFFAAFVLLSLRELSLRRRRRLMMPRCHRGIDPAAVPVCLYQPDAKQPDCVICLEEFEECEEVKIVPYCKHVFHSVCIDTWLSSHVTCPICRCVVMVCGGGNVNERVGRSTVENGGDGEVGER